MSLGYWETLVSLAVDGATQTAVGPTTLLTAGGTMTQARCTLAGNRLRIGDIMHLRAGGRISCAVTTPGTARFRLIWGNSGTGVAFMDTLAIPLNIVVQTTQPWVLDMEGIVRVVGGATQLFWLGTFASQAVIGGGTQGAATGTPTIATVPWNVAPVLGTAFDSTIAPVNGIDFDFTQTVSTGSLTLHTYALSLKTSSGF